MQPLQYTLPCEDGLKTNRKMAGHDPNLELSEGTHTPFLHLLLKSNNYVSEHCVFCGSSH